MRSEAAEVLGPSSVRQITMGGLGSMFVDERFSDLRILLSGVGKVAAATTTFGAITQGGLDAVVVLGVSGSLSEKVRFGDGVLATAVVEHDLDLRPILDLPGTASSTDTVPYAADPTLSAAVSAAYLRARSASQVPPLLSQVGELHVGTVGTGDHLVTSTQRKSQVVTDFPGTLCVDMETAATARVCQSFGVPWAALRVISDAADESFSAEGLFDLLLGYGASLFGAMVNEIHDLWTHSPDLRSK